MFCITHTQVLHLTGMALLEEHQQLENSEEEATFNFTLKISRKRARTHTHIHSHMHTNTDFVS